jgi:signal peptidase I
VSNSPSSSSKEDRERRKAERARSGGSSEKAGRSSGKGAAGKAKKPKGKVREWVDAMVFAVVVMVILRTFLFDLYQIPTPSMEKNLLVGDYLFVSKLHYGTRTPMTVGIPFTQVYLPGVHLPWTRFPGFSEVKRGDSFVFNWPADDVESIDRRMHYIKRVMGLPGDTLQIIDKVVHINGEPHPLIKGMQQNWWIYKTDPRVTLNASALAELGVTDCAQTENILVVQCVATTEASQNIEAWPWVERVEPAIARPNPVYDANMYPPGHGYTTDNYGPVVIPKQGVTVTLTEDNWDYLETVIGRHEGHTVMHRQGGPFVIDGQERTDYTFQQDYFFAMGDNRDNSEDSRFWGFVPFDHVVGKALLVYFSWNKDTNLPRFSRLFSRIR